MTLAPLLNEGNFPVSYVFPMNCENPVLGHVWNVRIENTGIGKNVGIE
jgi:hypothetical protein